MHSPGAGKSLCSSPSREEGGPSENKAGPQQSCLVHCSAFSCSSSKEATSYERVNNSNPKGRDMHVACVSAFVAVREDKVLKRNEMEAYGACKTASQCGRSARVAVGNWESLFCC